jgi:hypothetical protein
MNTIYIYIYMSNLYVINCVYVCAHACDLHTPKYFRRYKNFVYNSLHELCVNKTLCYSLVLPGYGLGD